jgi:hypothetical protein
VPLRQRVNCRLNISQWVGKLYRQGTANDQGSFKLD